MKKIFIMFILTILLASCSEKTEEKNDFTKIEEKKETYTVGLKENNFLNIYGNIVNSSIKIISPNINGKISYLSCEAGTKVGPNTLIASISPNYDGQSYQNNSIQANTLIEQIQKLNEMKDITNQNLDAQKKQILLQKEEINNSRENISENIGTDKTGLKNQQKILEENIELLKKNQIETEKDLENQMLNLKKNIYNNILKASKKLDETINIKGFNNIGNSKNYIFIGAKNNILKNEIENRAIEIMNFSKNLDENLANLKNKEIYQKLDWLSIFYKDLSQLIKESLSGIELPQSKVDALFSEFFGYSDNFINLKNNLEKIENSKNTTKNNFDLKFKELEAKISSLKSEETNLKNKQNSINISEKNIDEQVAVLEETRKSKLKEIDLQILSAEQNLKAIGINLQSENLYAETSGIIKQKIVKALGAQVQIGTQICEIIPEKNSLKLEIYSPEKLNIGDKFNFYKDGKKIGSGSIISEYPERNPQTQNFIYEGKIELGNLKLGEYLDIKILKQTENNEIWVPLKYISPKLDGYYVKKILEGGTKVEKKVEIGNMNNGEIKIISGIKKGDILEK